ncbi:HNH endonuclease signature motif containing protein [Nonomuraea glycinis]|uniref:HNH endonuclease signature motif containing protein n=1 Tax=Nonomuraea glycinis TaxID=2047744 RepID=UPI002E0FD442|nr:HNH endonuclease [Nonomuraea glycinis]
MRPYDENDVQLNSVFAVERLGARLALILESAGGSPPRSQPRQDLPRNSDYELVLTLLLDRLRMLDAVIIDAQVISRTALQDFAEDDRRLLKGVSLGKLAETATLADELTRGQRGIGRSPDGNRRKRIRLTLEVPGFGPEDGPRLEASLARSRSVPSPTGPSSTMETLFEGALNRHRIDLHRGEQEQLRNYLLPPEVRVGQCALCGVELPRRLLVAAHIKPRSECSDDERRQLSNIGMAVCLLGCDTLYELGYIGVSDVGMLLVSSEALLLPDPTAGFLRMRLLGRRTPWWNQAREKYYAWHRAEVFLG